ncbi:MAG: germination protein YpeB [Clostridia bacterium]|nr:germination protein YpeB [Clostridia bacterium]
MRKNKIISENFEENKEKSVSNVNNDKKTKRKSNAQKAMPIMIVTIVSLVVILTVVLIAYYQVYNSSKQNANVLEGVYASSYYSMVDNVNNLSVDISKYGNLSTGQAKMNTLQDMSNDCNYILAGLSILPINQENVVSAMKFFNQVNGVCEAYRKSLSRNETLSMEEELLIDKIGLVVARIKSNLNEQNGSMYDTGFNFVDAGVFDNTGMNELSSGMGDLSGDSIEYPAMIFDGPFSTALETKSVKGLGNKEYSQEEAYDYLKNVVYKNRDEVSIEYDRDTDGDIATYNYSIDIEGKNFTAQVSKVGRLLITLSGDVETGDAILGKNGAVEMATNFANNIGFESMQCVWTEIHDNVAYINLAPVIDDVIMYPDLVKIKVDMTAQDIVGLEAVNYALNHIDRKIDFNVRVNEAEQVLGFDYEIIETNKTVIRLDNGEEVSCYEFVLERIDGNYFYYINANTCEIEKIMKLVNVEDVNKLI